MDILSAHGSLDDDDTVANVIKMVIKCGETTNEALQLAVVRALLTFTTAGEREESTAALGLSGRRQAEAEAHPQRAPLIAEPA
jgi:hypothetical protein